MPVVRYGEYAAEVGPQETALDALLRAGAPVAHSCKAGSCGSCMLRAIEGDVPGMAQAGLKDSWRARGYLLPCVCHPESDLTLGPVESDAQIEATIRSTESLGAGVLRVRATPAASFAYHAGQFVSLVNAAGLARSYSLASLPGEDLEFHIRLLPGGRMSEWLRTSAPPGTRVKILGPSGECFYVPGQPSRPVLLVGTGTGLAPLYGIVRDALQSGHTGPLHLIHGAVREDGLYLREELARLAEQASNLHYTTSLLERDGPIDQAILRSFPQPSGWAAYLCGDPAIVATLRKKLFLAGLDLRHIHADAFLPAA